MKKFSNINQQINILKSRGMKFNNVSFAKDILRHISYYNIINAFKDLFTLKDALNETYIANLTFEEVYDIYLFDKDLRHLFLKYILQIETELRTHVAYVFGKNEGPYQYFDINSFDLKHSDYVIKMIESISSNINKQYKDTRDDMIGHFAKLNEQLPIWVLVNTFDFGLLKTFFLNMKVEQKKEITSIYSLSVKSYNSFLQTLHMFRNVCAHDYRILFYRIHDSNKKIVDTNIHKNLNIIKDTNNNYLYGKSDLYSLIIIFKYLLSDESFKEFFNELINLIDILKKELISIDINNIYKSIGFPTKYNNQLDFKEIININLNK